MRPFFALAGLVLTFTALLPIAQAQPREGRFVDVAAGIGHSIPEYDSSAGGLGFLVKGEYVLALTNWAGIRPYGGLVLTWPSNDENSWCEYYDCDVTAKAFMLGAKGRLAAPIPYVAPYLELGFGGSLGVIRTRTLSENTETKGAAYHIPFAVGLALGADHSVEIAFVYFIHPAQNQTNGGITVGLSFPLNKGKAE
jgi:hypothetical protein